MPPLVTAVVPTIGRSPFLADCLRSLRRDAGDAMVVVVVDQGSRRVTPSPGLADQIVRLERNLGFAGGTNRGFRGAATPYLAAVNDDVVVEAGWTRVLLDALEAHPQAASAQGVNLRLAQPQLVDGRGIAWNRWWQAVQVGAGESPPAAAEAPKEIFGVSATAALFRRTAVEETALAEGIVFDERLGSYYEDVELACRLRAAGYRSLAVPAARTRHAGSATAGDGGFRHWRAVYGNRYLVVARLLGSTFYRQLPRLLGRDLRDLGRHLVLAEGVAVLALLAGWLRALRYLPSYARRGGPAMPMADLEAFRVICRG